MDVATFSVKYTELERELPKLSKADQACVLAGFLEQNISILQSHTDSRDRMISLFDEALARVVDCLRHIAKALDPATEIVLRDVHVAKGRQIRCAGKAWGSYCVAAEGLGRIFYTAIFSAADKSGYHEWLLASAAEKSEFPTIDESKISSQWANVVNTIIDLPEIDFGELALGIQNEHIEVSDEKETAYFLGDGRYCVRDKVICLDGAQAILLETLVEIRGANLEELRNKSGVDGVTPTLKKICQNFPMLAPFITIPGGKGKGGYSTTIRNQLSDK